MCALVRRLLPATPMGSAGRQLHTLLIRACRQDRLVPIGGGATQFDPVVRPRLRGAGMPFDRHSVFGMLPDRTPNLLNKTVVSLAQQPVALASRKRRVIVRVLMV